MGTLAAASSCPVPGEAGEQAAVLGSICSGFLSFLWTHWGPVTLCPLREGRGCRASRGPMPSWGGRPTGTQPQGTPAQRWPGPRALEENPLTVLGIPTRGTRTAVP